MAVDNTVISNMSDKQILKLYHKNRNLFMIFSILLIIGLYIFFFMSPTIFRVPSEKLYTKIGKQEVFDEGRTVKVVSWVYSPKQQLMEAQLELSGSYEDTNNEYQYDSFVNYAIESKGSTQIQIEKKMEKYNLVVIWFHDIPDDFNTCSLNIYPNETTEDYGSVYTNSEKVKVVKNIKEKSEKQYRIEGIKLNIKQLETTITKNEKKIASLNRDIIRTEKQIKEVRNNEVYQSEEEIQDAEDTIKGYRDEIKNYNNEISYCKTNISDCKYDIQEYKKLIDKLNKIK